MRNMLALIFGILIFSSAADAQEKIRKDIHGDPLPEGALARLGTIKLRPGDVIQNLAFSPDGKQIACWTGRLYSAEANALAIYEVATGNELRWTAAHDARCHALMWLRDGRGLALVQPNPRKKQVFLWEFTDPNCALPISNQPRASSFPSPNVYALSPDGQWVVEADIERPRKEFSLDMRRWQSGKMFHELALDKTMMLGDHETRALLFTSDSKNIVCVSQRDKQAAAVVQEVTHGKRQYSLPLPEPPDVRGDHTFALAPGSEPTLAFQDFGSARIVKFADSKEELTIPFTPKPRFYHPGPMAFSPDGRHLALAQGRGSMRLWNLETNVEAWKADGWSLTCIAFSHDGSLVTSGDLLGQIRIWETATGKEISPVSEMQYTDRLVVAPSGKSAVTLGEDTSLCSWNLSTGALSGRTEKLGSTVWDLGFVRDSDSVIFSYKQQLKQWDLDTGITTIPFPTDHSFKRFKFSADGKTLASFFAANRLALWDWEQKSLRKSLSAGDDKKETRSYRFVVLSKDGRHVAAFGNLRSSGGSFLEIWDNETGKRHSQTGIADIACIQFAPSEPMLAVSVAPLNGERDYAEKRLMLLNGLTNEIVRYYKPPPNPFDSESRGVRAVAFSPDGRLLASAENNHSVVLFEVASGLPRRQILGHRNNVSHLEFTGNGRRLVTISRDLTGLVWDVSLPTAGKANASQETIKECWEELRNTKDGFKVHAALVTLAANPATFLDLCDKQLRPVPQLDLDAIKKWIAELDSPEFAVRSGAVKKLGRPGEDIVPLLRQALTKDIPLEQSRRLETLIARLDLPDSPPQRLQEMRAVEVLEYLATPEARKFLERVASGARQARLTVDARTSLERIAKHTKR